MTRSLAGLGLTEIFKTREFAPKERTPRGVSPPREYRDEGHDRGAQLVSESGLSDRLRRSDLRVHRAALARWDVTSRATANHSVSGARGLTKLIAVTDIVSEYTPHTPSARVRHAQACLNELARRDLRFRSADARPTISR